MRGWHSPKEPLSDCIIVSAADAARRTKGHSSGALNGVRDTMGAIQSGAVGRLRGMSTGAKLGVFGGGAALGVAAEIAHHRHKSSARDQSYYGMY